MMSDWKCRHLKGALESTTECQFSSRQFVNPITFCNGTVESGGLFYIRVKLTIPVQGLQQFYRKSAEMFVGQSFQNFLSYFQTTLLSKIITLRQLALSLSPFLYFSSLLKSMILNERND
jgi:hypothetical protein